MERRCPVCFVTLSAGADHRPCLVYGFQEGLFKSIAEWKSMCEPTKKYRKLRK